MGRSARPHTIPQLISAPAAAGEGDPILTSAPRRWDIPRIASKNHWPAAQAALESLSEVAAWRNTTFSKGERRSFPRHRLHHRILVKSPAGGVNAIEGITENMSSSGILLFLSHPLPPVQRLNCFSICRPWWEKAIIPSAASARLYAPNLRRTATRSR